MEEGDAYNGNDDERDEVTSIWKNNLDLWKPAEAFATTDVESESSDMKCTTRSFMDAKRLVAQVKIGAFDGVQSMTPRASAGTKVSGKRKGTSPSKNP